MSDKSQVALINAEVSKELADPAAARALLATTFKGLEPVVMKQALIEGMIRGFKFKDFLEKNVYAIPFSNGYSLVTSVDYARKRGMRAGIVGKDAPQYVMDGKKIVSCAITVYRMVGGHKGNFTAEVYFDEYDTGKNLWKTKPRTMIAKVAEMHALRMACPEELSQMYTEEEFQAENAPAREPMVKYEVKRVAPNEEDEAGGFRDQTPAETEPVIQTEEVEPVEEAPATKEVAADDPKALRMEIGQLLKSKKGYTSLGKTQEQVAEKVMAITGIAYEPENYKAIIEELKSL